MISAYHHATRMCMLLLSPYTAYSYTNLYSTGVQVVSAPSLSPTSTVGFPLPAVPTPGPSSSLHTPTSGKLPSHSYLLVGKCNVWSVALPLFQLWHSTPSPPQVVLQIYR